MLWLPPLHVSLKADGVRHYAFSTPNAEKVTVEAEEEALRYFSVAVIVTPNVKNTVSFAGTEAPYTRNSFCANVVEADDPIPRRYVATADAVLQIAIVDTTHVVAVGHE
jgi:hypothetical protein